MYFYVIFFKPFEIHIENNWYKFIINLNTFNLKYIKMRIKNYKNLVLRPK